jgi:SAM-dependent methyltransferase
MLRDIEACPSCNSKNCTALRELIIEDCFQNQEDKLQRTNSYQRNYILFEHILKRGVSRLLVTFLQCAKCGFIFFTPRPDQADLKIKYDLIVESQESVKRERAFQLIDLRHLRASSIAMRLSGHFDQRPSMVLDIGGADGHCIQPFASDATCHVLDFERRAMVGGVERIGDTMDDIPSDQRYDLVVTCHTLEHVDDINTYVWQIGSLLRPNGLVYIEVPLGCNGEINTVRNLLTHLNFFSSGSLGALLERNGFRIEECRAAPVMSSKRYLPVVYAIARKATPSGEFSQSAVARTQAENTGHIDRSVALANVGLVARNPLRYAAAFLGRVIRR